MILIVYLALSKIDIFPEDENEAPVAEPIILDLVETPDDAIRRAYEKARLPAVSSPAILTPGDGSRLCPGAIRISGKSTALS
jgi:hypothetical protein